MVAIKGHFDGKVFIPDEPVNLPRNQPVTIHVEPSPQPPIDYTTWIGLGKRVPEDPNARFKSDNDLWED